MYGNNLKIEISRNYLNRDVSIYVFEEFGNDLIFYSYKDKKIERTKIDRSELGGKPFLILSDWLFKSLLESFIKEGNNINIHTENELLIKGKLEATERHLSDMKGISEKLFNLLKKIK